MKEMCVFRVFSYGNARPLSNFLKACGRWGHVFNTNASPRPWAKKAGNAILFLLFMTVSKILNM